MKIQKVNEATAWKIVEMIFESTAGICHAKNRMITEGLINDRTWKAMTKRLDRYARRNKLHGYYWPLPEHGRDRDEARTAFAQQASRAAARRKVA